MTVATPYKLAVSDADLNDLRTRLAMTRWPTEVAPETWERGIPGSALKALTDHWLQKFDWRKQESLINSYDQVMIEHGGEQVHAFHIRSPRADAIPLVLCHGWPSSGIEYLKLVEPLTKPSDGGQAFHLVIPTSPGFGLSPAPRQPGWTSTKTAAAVVALLDQIGYEKFALHGSDMGSDVAAKIDVAAPGRAIGLHLATDTDSVIAVASFMGGDASKIPGLADEQRERVQQRFAAQPDRNGYIAIQSSRPKTLGYALNDSPVGQLAWIAEKFAAWTNPRKAGIADAVDLDQFLTNVSLYWFGGGGAGSANALWESFRAMGWAPPSATPRGIAAFNADDLVRALFDPERKIAHWTEYTAGGHFPAMEEPALLAEDLQTFFAPLRQ